MTAAQLQRALLPPAPADPRLEVAARYVPGADGMLVGGDWYDVVTQPDGAFAVAVGDVMGRGARAAATMGQLRPALAACGQLGVEPGGALTLLDTMIGRADPDAIATVVVATLDPRADPGGDAELTVVSAGHLPPVLVGPDGTGGPITVQPGPPVGVPGERPAVRLTVPAGSTLALFTDGLVEHRGQDIDAGLHQLTDVLADAGGLPLDELADVVLRAMGRAHGHDDDVALLLLRVRPHGLQRTTLPPGPKSVGLARRTAAQACRAAGREDAVDLVTLLVSEVVTNALLHAAGGRVELGVEAGPDGIRIEVTDAGPGRPVRREAGDDDERGRGILLVDRLAEDWGVRESDEGTDGTGKTVWFTLS
jgi:anti-sigma regulatory factor (Ser/Thr protein kinase)